MGACAADRARPRRLEAGYAVLRQHFLIEGAPIADELIVEIVDEVILPLLGVEPD